MQNLLVASNKRTILGPQSSQSLCTNVDFIPTSCVLLKVSHFSVSPVFPLSHFGTWLLPSVNLISCCCSVLVSLGFGCIAGCSLS